MKIVFVISSIYSKSNGKGGHYYSLLETVKQVFPNARIENKIIVIDN